MNGKPPKFTSTWKTIPNPQFDAKGIYRKELAPPPPKFTSTWKTIPNPQFDAKGIYRKELAPPTLRLPQSYPKATPRLP
jgi:hypothetical protein